MNPLLFWILIALHLAVAAGLIARITANTIEFLRERRQ